VKLLHTSDWHVGKTLRGISRADEHRAVLAEINQIALDEQVDLVAIGGDIFDSAAPTAESESIVYEALLRFSMTCPKVVVIAGNHDGPRRLDAVSAVFDRVGVTVIPAVRSPENGGVVRFETAKRERVNLVAVPFVGQRGIVRADELMNRGADEWSGRYADRLARVVERLSESFAADSVNLVLAHMMVAGGTMGGGERSAHTVFDYSMPATAFATTTHYVGLGHLHRAQNIPGPCPIRYCGSPFALDFGETADRHSVTVVTAEPGRPAQISTTALQSGRALRTITVTPEDVSAAASVLGDTDFARVVVNAARRPGLIDDVREAIPQAVDIIVREPDGERRTHRSNRDATERSLRESFKEYLDQDGVESAALVSLFDELTEERLEEQRATPAS
jgi:exonuclease SbcD